MQLVNIGFGNIVSAERIVAIVSPESAPIKRMVQEAKDNKTAVDATYGRRTRAVLIMDSGHIILSAVQPETVGGRIDKSISQEFEKWDKRDRFKMSHKLSRQMSKNGINELWQKNKKVRQFKFFTLVSKKKGRN